MTRLTTEAMGTKEENMLIRLKAFVFTWKKQKNKEIQVFFEHSK